MRILFATGNADKINEAAQILKELGHSVEQLMSEAERIEFDEPKNLGLEGVALSKIEQARAMIEGTESADCAILVEDSGIFLHAFDEWPGANSSDVEQELGLDGILDLLTEEQDRGAEYRAVAVLALGERVWKTSGVCRGRISAEKLGDNGFGYDPIFIPDAGDGRTFGQMFAAAKNLISHRRAAMQALAELLKTPSK